MNGRSVSSMAAMLVLVAACSSSSTNDGSPDAGSEAAPPLVEKPCGPGAGMYSVVYTKDDVARLAGCTTFTGRLQEDSVSGLSDFTGLESLRKIEGTLNVFRSPGFVSLKGLDNLETVDGDLFIHMNPNLRTLAGLERLRVVTGKLLIQWNDVLPLEEAKALAARVSVGGGATIEGPL